MPILDSSMLEFLSKSEEQTMRLGAHLGNLLQVNDLICLSGEIGTGKTILVKGIGCGWGAQSQITSAMNVIIKEFPRASDNGILYLIDCFRLSSLKEAYSTGIDDVLLNDRGVVVIEWAEKIESILPSDRLWIHLKYVDASCRHLLFEASGKRSLQLLRDFRKATFNI
jgi:tRNA threonylcarbamoyladenosine biosynthesis protein TsaE